MFCEVLNNTEQICYGRDTSEGGMGLHGQIKKMFPTSPEGAMSFFGSYQIIDSISNKILQNYKNRAICLC